MANDVALFMGSTALSVPAHIAEAYKPEESNLVEQSSRPSLTIKGKVFTMSADGETTKLVKIDGDGEEVPVSTLPVVILDYAKNRGRSYYEGAFNDQEVKPPTCWSTNAIVPDAEVPEKVSAKCAGCPMSIKGSAVDDSGNPRVACGEHRILAVVPIKRLDMTPLRLRIAVTSDWDNQDKETQAKGKFAFQQLISFIKGKGVPHTQAIVTKLSFDMNKAYPKLLFSPSRWLEPAETAAVRAIVAGNGIEAILGETSAIPAKRVAASSTAPALASPDVAAAALEKARTEAAAAEQAKAAAEKAAADKAAAKAAKKAEKDAAAAAAAAKPAEKFLPEEAAKAAAIADLGGDDDDDDGGVAAVTAGAAGTVGAAADDDDDDEEDEDVKAALTLIAAAATKKAAKAAGATAAPAAPAKAPAKPKTAPAPVAAEVPAEVAAMLNGWDNE